MSAAEPDRYAVVGFPVKHSRSPFIHGMFARQTGQNMSYRLMEVPPDQLQSAVEDFFAAGGKGLNLTLPHKQAALALVKYCTPRAEFAGAINTITLQGDELLGDNTDGAGLLADLTQNLKIELEDRRILLLGAGGAARGVVAPLLQCRPTLIEIANRDGGRARQLAEEFKSLGTVRGGSFTELGQAPFDVVINATSASLQGTLPPVPPAALGSQTLCYDMAYGKQDTVFLIWAAEHGAGRTEQGWGMLVEQAAEAFLLWRGVRPDTRPVLDAVKSPAPERAGSAP